MARGKIIEPRPVLTHTEILARALRSIDDEINHWREACESSGAIKHFDDLTAELRAKREAAANLYRIETGVDYD